MSRNVRWFIRSALVWLILGVLMGLGLALAPARFAVLRPVHMHMNLLGFVTLMIFGVGYQVLPRFSGGNVLSERLIPLNLLASNLGLALMVGGWVLRATVPSLAPGMAVVLGVGGVVAGAGALMFVVNLWGMLGAVPRRGALPGVGAPSCGGIPPGFDAPGEGGPGRPGAPAGRVPQPLIQLQRR